MHRAGYKPLAFGLSLGILLTLVPIDVRSQEKETVFISNLQGILLLGDAPKSRSNTSPPGAIEWTGLDIPGDPARLQELLAPFLHHPVKEETVNAMKKVITDYYLEERRPFVLVTIPTQRVHYNTLAFSVVESKLGELKSEGNAWFSSEHLQQYMCIKSGDVLDESCMLRDVSFINRNPFRRVDLVFAPGKEAGTTDVILSTKDRRPLRVYAGSDNTGVDPIEDNRFYVGFNWGNAFGCGHVLSYQFTASYNTHKFQAHTAEYIAPFSWGHLLNVYGGYCEVHPKVHAPIRRNDGWNMQVSERYLIPLKIYAYLEQEIFFGGDFKRSNNTFAFTEQLPLFGKNVNLTQVMLGYGGNYERNTFRIDFRAEVFCSPGKWIADQKNEDFSSLRPGAVNHWIYGYGFLTYLQKLPHSFSLHFTAEGQVSNEPLLPSEQLGLGGYNTVRGYEEREVNKDDAARLSLELRFPQIRFSKKGHSLQFLGFTDYGWGINIDRIPGTQKADYLLSAGPGLRYTLEPYLTIRCDWGFRLHNKAEFEGGWNKVHFNATASY